MEKVSKRITFCTTPKEYQIIRDVAVSEGRTISNLLRRLVLLHLPFAREENR